MVNFCRSRVGERWPIPSGWYLIILAIAVTKRYAFHPSAIKLLDNYLLDLLCMPLILETLSLSMRTIFSVHYKLSIYQIGFSLVSTSVLFEYFLPMYQTRFHADVFDVVAYSAGTIIWCLFLRKKA